MSKSEFCRGEICVCQIFFVPLQLISLVGPKLSKMIQKLLGPQIEQIKQIYFFSKKTKINTFECFFY